jgi:hypothetical protein
MSNYTKHRNGQHTHDADDAIKFCPNCKKGKNISAFGHRMMDPETMTIRVQSWCKKCRLKYS